MSEVTAELPMLALILHLALNADRHRLEPELEVHDVGRDDHPAARNLVPDLLGFPILAAGDKLHLGGDDSLTRLLDLCHRRLTSCSDVRTTRTGDPTGQRPPQSRPRTWSSGKPYPRRPTPRRSIRPRRVLPGRAAMESRRPGAFRSVVPFCSAGASPGLFSGYD